MKGPIYKLEAGRKAARYFGTECQANNGRFAEYSEDIADAYGVATWGQLPGELKAEARLLFQEGVQAEKTLTGGTE